MKTIERKSSDIFKWINMVLKKEEMTLFLMAFGYLFIAAIRLVKENA